MIDMPASKVLPLAELAALVPDGASVAPGGSFLHRGPFAFVRELSATAGSPCARGIRTPRSPRCVWVDKPIGELPSPFGTTGRVARRGLIARQFDNPGDPLSIVIGRNGLPRAQFETSALSAELADFLTGTPWIDA